MVITSGQVGVELPMDSEEANEENQIEDGKTLLYVFSRGSAHFTPRLCLQQAAAIFHMSWPVLLESHGTPPYGVPSRALWY